MMDRKIESEKWWTSKDCPFIPSRYQDEVGFCSGSQCAFWVTLRIDKDKVRYGVCTKA